MFSFGKDWRKDSLRPFSWAMAIECYRLFEFFYTCAIDLDIVLCSVLPLRSGMLGRPYRSNPRVELISYLISQEFDSANLERQNPRL